MNVTSRPERVPLSVKLSYACPGLILAMMAIPFYVFIPKFYTDVVGVSAAFVGGVILLSRLFDALIDPVIGRLSDRTKSKYGRRRSWIAVGALPLAITFYLLLSPPGQGSAVFLSAWLAILTFLFFLFWTFVSVPYQALGNELTLSQDERTRILGFRDAGVVLGTLLAIVVPFAITKLFSLAQDNPGSRSLYQILGLGYGVALVLAICICVKVVRETKWGVSLKSAGTSSLSIFELKANKPFMILLTAYFVGGFGSQLPAAMFLYYVQYVLGGTPEQSYSFLILYFLIGFAFLPLWIWLATKFSKRNVWIASMIVNAGAFAGVAFLGNGDFLAYGVIVALSGIGYGAVLAIPSAMQGDVLDFEELRSGARREGEFTGLWLVVNKLSGALGAGIGQLLLASAGYVPNAVQTPAVQTTLTVLYGVVPCLCYGIAMIIAFRYPIDRDMFASIQTQLQARSGRVEGS